MMTDSSSLSRRVWRFIQRRALLLILLLAVVLRVGVALALPTLFAFDQTGAVHGSAAYDAYAQNLLTTGVYGRDVPGVPDAHLPPFYSYVLAGLYGLFGRGAVPVIALHIIFDVISIVCLYHIARRLFPHGRAVGLLAALAYASYPYLIFQNLTLIDTPLFMALLYSFLLGIVVVAQRPALDRRTLLIAAGAGVLLGLLALTRTNAVIFALFAAVWVWMLRGFRPAFVRLLPVALVSLLTVLPWIARSSALYGTFVPIALNGGENFYQGNSIHTVPYFRAGYDVQWVPPPEGIDYPDPFGPPANNARMRAGLDFLTQNPQLIPELAWVKFLVHWSIDIAPLRNPVEGVVPRLNYQGDVIAETTPDGALALGALPPGDPVGAYSAPLFDQIGRAVHRVYFGGLLALAVIGFVLSLKAGRGPALIVLVQVANTLSYVIFHPSTRYRVPTDPLLFTLSAYAVVVLALSVQAWQARRTAPGAVHAPDAAR